MSQSDVIDRRYRLLPADLAGRSRQVVVRSVTLEGVESLTPLIHFEDLGRPLALDPDQRIEMARIAGSTILADWVGIALVLDPVRDRGGEHIRLLHVDDRLPLHRRTAQNRRAPDSATGPGVLWRLLAIMVVVAAILAVVWLVENTENLNSLLDVFN